MTKAESLRIPWGLDPFSLMAGLTIGLASSWWIGLASWAFISGLFWLGWLWTRKFASKGAQPEITRRFRVIFHVTLALLGISVLLQVAVKWGTFTAGITSLAFASYFSLVRRFTSFRRSSSSF
jgi:hypothetical protein